MMVSRHSAMLDHLTYRGIPPVKGMREAIYTVRETIGRRIEPTRWGGFVCARLSGGRREELQRDAVGIAEAQPRAVVGVHDAAVLDAELDRAG